MKIRKLKKKVITTLVLAITLFVAFSCNQQPELKTIIEKTPWGIEEFQYPEIKKQEYDITSYGAVKNKPINNQKAIQSAIDACFNNGGGKVVVPKGTWHTSFLELKSGVNLHIEKGAVLSFIDSVDLYKVPTFTRWEGIECMNYHPFIYAKDGSNIAITGSGKIDGNGKSWWKLSKKQYGTLDQLYTQVQNNVAPEDRNCLEYEGGSFLRPSLVQFINVKNVLVDSIEIGSGPMWTLHLVYCENVIAQNIRVITHGTNNDGIIPDASKKVLINNCYFSTGDDCIVIKSGLNEDGWRVGKSSERIVIKNCNTHHGHGGVVIGSEMSGGVQNIYAYDCNFSNTDRGLRVKSMQGRGGFVKNLWFQNIRMDSIQREAIKINMRYGASSIEPRNNKTPVFSNFNFSDITSSNSRYSVRIDGLPQQKVDSMSFTNMEMQGQRGIEISHATNINFNNVQIESDSKNPVKISDCANVEFVELKLLNKGDSLVKLEGFNQNIIVNNSNISDQ